MDRFYKDLAWAMLDQVWRIIWIVGLLALGGWCMAQYFAEERELLGAENSRLMHEHTYLCEKYAALKREKEEKSDE